MKLSKMVLALAMSGSIGSLWSADYAHEYSLRVDGYAGETLSDYVLLVRISEAHLENFSYAESLSSGADFRFYDEAGHGDLL